VVAETVALLEDISMAGTPETVTSTVMNLTTGRVYLALGRNYHQIKRFSLKKRDYGEKSTVRPGM
jgi:hypothetical protein